jgi:hypothetical protein
MNDPWETHNALEDAELTAECMARIMHGRNSLQKYSKYPVPEYLKSNH